MVYTSLKENTENILDDFQDVDTSKVSDNIEEAVSSLIYETEVNWNILMQAVGIAELTAMENVGEVIYEAVDIKAFFGKIKEFFKGLLDKIARLFKKIVETVQNWFNSIKKTFYDNKFKNLTSVPEGFAYEGYEFSTVETKLVRKKYSDWASNWSPEVDELDGSNINDVPGYDEFDLDPDESIKAIKNRIAILNDQGVKKKLIDSMRSYLLYNTVSDDYDWNKEIFKCFRHDEEKPKELTAKNINIAYYKEFVIDIYPRCSKIAKDCYKLIEEDVKYEMDHLITLTNNNKRYIKSNREHGWTEYAEHQEYEVQLAQIQIRYIQEYLNSAASVQSGLLKAFADQAKQYYSALVKMLQMSKSSNNSENDKATNEDFDITHSLLDNVNFI